MTKPQIGQVEPQFAQKLNKPFKTILQELSYAVPADYQLRASFLDANGRKKRSNASADNWSPETGRIEIWFEQAMPDQDKMSFVDSSGEVNSLVADAEKVLERNNDDFSPLLKALDRAEATPGWNFVPLKKFRDEILPSEQVAPGAWKPTDVHWHALLRHAIENKFILVGKVPNPKAPQFPVTTIRLNRLMADVQRILGKDGDTDSEFHPIEIHGEPLSTTILRERR